MKPVSLAKLRSIAAPATIEDDRLGGSYRATAPDGYRWGQSDCHELVSWYQDASERAEARVNLAADVRADRLEPCDDPECEWCHPSDESEVGHEDADPTVVGQPQDVDVGGR